MNEAVKKQLKVSSEKVTEVALTEVIALAEVYAASTESTVDDNVVAGVKMLKQAFLDDLVNKIDGEEG